MFKLPNPPSTSAAHHELADFVEILCITQNGVASNRDAVACLGRLSDNEYNSGCDDDSDVATSRIDDAMDEIDRRARACGPGYPFRLEQHGTVLRQVATLTDLNYLYLYLLLATRLNMTMSKVHDGIDGTQILEHIGAAALKSYLGSNRAKSFIFGTAVSGGFQKKVEDLCARIGEGGTYRNLDLDPSDANDDKLDAVAWVPFADALGGQLIVFAQCKTGSNWEQETTQLQPEVFVDRWLLERPIVTPVRAFIVAEACNIRKWNRLGYGSGLLFDRCRIVDCCQTLTQSDFHDIKRWTISAIGTLSFKPGGPRKRKRRTGVRPAARS